MTTAALASQIRTEGEDWKDAMKRASEIQKAEKAAAAETAPETPKAPAAKRAKKESPATAPAKVEGKWSVAHNGETIPFKSRRLAARYYRANRAKN